DPCLKPCAVPATSERRADLRTWCLPLRFLRQVTLHSRQDVDEHGAGAKVETERDQALALFIRDSRVAEGQNETARDGLRHALEAPHGIGQVKGMLKDPLRIARHRVARGNRHLALSPPPRFAKKRAKAIEPVAFK